MTIEKFFSEHRDERYTIPEWTEILRQEDILIVSNASEIPHDRVLDSNQMRIIVEEECQWREEPFEIPTAADVKTPNPSHVSLETRVSEFFIKNSGQSHTIADWLKLLVTFGLEIKNNASEEPVTKILSSVAMRYHLNEWIIVGWIENKSLPAPVLSPAAPAPITNDKADSSGYLEPKTPAEKMAPGSVALALKWIEPAKPAPKQPPLLKAIPIDVWRRNFKRDFDMVASRPPINQTIRTEDGSPIRIDFDFREGQLPSMRTHIYVCRVVGRPIEWVAQRERDNQTHGWRVLFLPWSRDQAIDRFDLAKDYDFVQEIRVMKTTANGELLLAEITKWNT